MLVGQPELDAKLRLPGLRQLRQRVAVYCTIPPLTDADTRSLIFERLRSAGARNRHLFTDAAIARIARYAQGNPRLVIMTCDHCLLVGFAEQQRRIDAPIVNDVIAELKRRGPQVAKPRSAGLSARLLTTIGLLRPRFALTSTSQE